MADFAQQLEAVLPVVDRFVRFHMRDNPDAEDVLQEVYTQAYLKYSQLRSPDAFKPWVLAIARNCCARRLPLMRVSERSCGSE